jgi:protein-arginine kinase activator protein McsA
MISLDMLKEALQKAVENENYEQASKLRDEIKRREEEQQTENEP